MRSNKPLSDKLLTEAEVAAIDRLSRSSRYRAMHTLGYPLPIKVGGKNLWPENAVRLWLASRPVGLAVAPEAALAGAAAARFARVAGQSQKTETLDEKRR